MGKTGIADPKTRYVVHATCMNAQSVTYRITVNGQPFTESAFSCGTDSVSTAFFEKSGLVQIEFIDLAQDAAALAEVVPDTVP